MRSRLAALFVTPAPEAPALRLVPPPAPDAASAVVPAERERRRTRSSREPASTRAAAVVVAATAGAHFGRAAAPPASGVGGAPAGAQSGDVAAAPLTVVLGGGRAGVALAAAVAARLARADAEALLCLAPDDAALAPRPPALASRDARRRARSLVVDGEDAVVRGRVVELRSLAPVRRPPGVPVVVARPGVRDPADDALLATAGRILVVVAPDAPAALTELAVAELAAHAPGAAVLAVPLPVRPRPAARRRALRLALGAAR